MDNNTSYSISRCLGQCSYSSTYLAVHIQSSKKVVIKKISRSNKGNWDKLQRNLRGTLAKIDHPYILHLFDLKQSQDFTSVIMEYCPNGSLDNIIRNTGAITDLQLQTMFGQLVSAFDYFHNSLGVCHRDLEAKNILLDENNNVRVEYHGPLEEFKSENSNLFFQSPEVCMNEPYTTKADVWSLGILLFFMATGTLPFNDEKPEQLMKKICYSSPDFPVYLSDGLVDLITKMLEKSPITRISIGEIQVHPWFVENAIAGRMNRFFGEKEGLRYKRSMTLLDKLFLPDSISNYHIESEPSQMPTEENLSLGGLSVLRRSANYRTSNSFQVPQSIKTMSRSRMSLGQPLRRPLTQLIITPTFSSSEIRDETNETGGIPSYLSFSDDLIKLV